MIIAGSVSNDEAKEIWPDGWEEPKPYIRIVPQPQLVRRRDSASGSRRGIPACGGAHPGVASRALRLLPRRGSGREPICVGVSYPWGQHTTNPEGGRCPCCFDTHGGSRSRRRPPRSRSGSRSAVAAAADARGQATAIGLIATMNAPSEVPAPAGDVSGARGAFTATATQSGTGAALEWQMTFSGLTGPGTAAHIHVATRGQAGPVAVPLCGPCTSPASGTATVDATVLAALQSGGAYVNVHTDTNKAGEIRGQVGMNAPVAQRAHVAAGGAEAQGQRQACRRHVRRHRHDGGDDRLRRVAAHFARLTGRAVAAHIHIGRAGRAGPVAVALCGPCRSGQRGTRAVNAATLAALEAGRAYVNVHTARNPAGEIRGQLPAAALRIT